MTNHGAVAVQFSVLLTLNPPLRSDEDRVVPVQPGIISPHKAEGCSIVAERLRGPARGALPSVSRPSAIPSFFPIIFQWVSRSLTIRLQRLTHTPPVKSGGFTRAKVSQIRACLMPKRLPSIAK